MATLHPFKAWHPDPQNVEEVACVPYDVINTKEARSLASGKPKSFLHVVRPEIDLPEGTDLHDEAVYRTGAANLNQFMDEGILKQDDQECVYIYKLIRNKRTQTGIFACLSVDDYDNEVILKHELTRPAKEDDRTRHIVTQQAHAEPVMITYNDDNRLQELMDDAMKKNPFFNFEAPDGVTHKLWRVPNAADFVEAFEAIPRLYIADGHHRCKSASRAAEKMRKENPNHTGREEYNFFPAVVFPMSDMDILAYNRIIHSVPDNFLQTLTDHFGIKPAHDPIPAKKGDIRIFIDERWFRMTLPVDENPTAVEQLDVYRLQEFLLKPLLNITDVRRDENISFVGGIRGTQELEKLVTKGDAEMAISMYPTGIEELIQVSDEKLLMPPKSTWFEPKLRSGLLVHTF